MQRLPTSFLINTWWCTYVSAALSVHPSLPFHLCVRKSLLYVCVSVPALQIGSSVPFFRLYISRLHLGFLDEVGSNIVSRMWFVLFCFSDTALLPTMWTFIGTFVHTG